MEYLITTCCADKSQDPALLPAIERYRSERIATVRAESEARTIPMLILSGRYGLLAPEDPIHWYDYALPASAVDALATRIAAQLEARGATRVEFHGEPPEVSGWAPYYDALRSACLDAGVDLELRLLPAGA